MICVEFYRLVLSARWIYGCAAGIGTPLAIAGASAHAFCHIVYKGLLWMSAGAVCIELESQNVLN